MLLKIKSFIELIKSRFRLTFELKFILKLWRLTRFARKRFKILRNISKPLQRWVKRIKWQQPQMNFSSRIKLKRLLISYWSFYSLVSFLTHKRLTMTKNFYSKTMDTLTAIVFSHEYKNHKLNKLWFSNGVLKSRALP